MKIEIQQAIDSLTLTELQFNSLPLSGPVAQNATVQLALDQTKWALKLAHRSMVEIALKITEMAPSEEF